MDDLPPDDDRPWRSGLLAGARASRRTETWRRTDLSKGYDTALRQEPVRRNGSMQVPAKRAAETAPAHGAVMTPTAAKMLAVLRVATGVIFLWAFLDKRFGLGYATGSQNAWINGGSPTKGFLSRVAVGPFESLFHSWAGAAWADWLFMLGLLAIGIALILGIGLRL